MKCNIVGQQQKCNTWFILLLFQLCVTCSPAFAQQKVVSIARSTKVISPSGPVTALTLAGKENVVVSGHADGKVYWWDAKGTQVQPAWPESGSAVSALVLLNNEQELGIVRQEPEIQIWNLREKSWKATIKTPERVDLLEVNFIGYTMAMKSSQIQINHAHGELVSQQPVDSAVSSIGFLETNKVLALASLEKQTVTAIPSGKLTGSNVVKFETVDLKRANKKLIDVDFSRFGNVILAAYDDGTIVPLLGERYRAQGEAKFTEFKLNRVLLQKSGWNVVYLGVDNNSNEGRGSIWDLANQRKIADLRDVPAKFKSAVMAPEDKLLAITDDSGAIHIWELPKEAIGGGVPSVLLAGKVKKEPWDAPLPAETPVTHAKWKIERWSNAAAPAYLKKAWKLTPGRDAPSASVLQVHEPGAFFAAISAREPKDDAQWNKLVLQRSFMLGTDGWIDFGECPWKPGARLYCAPRDKGSSELYGQDPDPERDDFLFVPGTAYEAPENAKMLPSLARSHLITMRVRRWLFERDYKKVEQLSNTTRRSKEMLGWGQPTLGAIYAAFRPIRQFSEEEIEKRINEYVAQEKNSITAQIALAKHKLLIGWNRRGGEIGANLTAEQQRQFTTYLQQAQTILSRIESKAADDPYWEETALRALPGRGLTTSNIQKLVLSSVKKNPRCTAALSQASVFLLPRWIGEPGAAHKLAEELRTKVAGENGVALAAFLASQMYWLEPDRWDADFGFDADQYTKDSAVLQRLCSDDDRWKTVAARMDIPRLTPDEGKALWRSLGTHIDVFAFGGYAQAAEWNDWIEETPQPALLWSVMGRASGLVAASPSGTHLLTGSPAGQMRFLDVTNGKLQGEDKAPFLAPVAIVMPADDRALFAHESGIIQFDNKSGVKRLAFPRPIIIQTAQFSPDGKRLVIIDKAGTILFLDAETGQTVTSINNGVEEKHRERPAIAVSSDNALTAVSTGGNVVTLFRTETGAEMTKLPAPGGDSFGLCFHHGSEQLAAASDTKIWNWDLAAKKETWSSIASRGGTSRLKVSENGRYWAVLTNNADPGADMLVHVFDRERMPERWRMLPTVRSYADFAWNPKQSRLAVYSISGIISYWDADKLP